MVAVGVVVGVVVAVVVGVVSACPMTEEKCELLRRPPWVGARIIDRGAGYVVIGGYHASDEKAIAAGEAPHFWAAACVHRHGVYPLRWTEETRSGSGYTLVQHPTLDLWDADTRHNFLRRYPDADVSFWETP